MRLRPQFVLPILLLAALPALADLHRVVLRPADWAGTLRALSGMHADIAGADHQSGTIEVIADDAFLSNLKILGVPLKVEQTLGAGLRGSDLPLYTDPEELEAAIFGLAAQYPDLMEIVVLADDLFEGHTVYAVKLGSSVLKTPKPVFLLDAQHHAREVMTPEIALDMIQYLLVHYGSDERVTRWMDRVEIWVVPCVNPDGSMFVFKQNNWWRRNRNLPCPVDLNRNYPYNWGGGTAGGGWGGEGCNGSSGECLSDTYRGSSAGSEPETRGVLALMYAVKPHYYLTYHSYGQYIIYPFGCGRAAEDAAFFEIARDLNAILEDDKGRVGRYMVGNSEDVLYRTDGTSDDEPYAGMGTFPYCIEVNSYDAGGFQPSYSQWRDITVLRQRVAWGFFLDRILDGPQVRGTVRDPLRQGPVPGAAVTVEGLNFTNGELPRTTDSHGRYFVIARRGQAFSLTFSAPGYHPVTVAVSVGTGPVDLDVVLEPTGSGKPVAGQEAFDRIKR
jgi:carboxypeptidase T